MRKHVGGRVQLVGRRRQASTAVAEPPDRRKPVPVMSLHPTRSAPEIECRSADNWKGAYVQLLSEVPRRIASGLQALANIQLPSSSAYGDVMGRKGPKRTKRPVMLSPPLLYRAGVLLYTLIMTFCSCRSSGSILFPSAEPHCEAVSFPGAPW